MSDTQKRILIVDGDVLIITSLTAIFEQQGYVVDSMTNGWGALLKISKNNYDIIITELMLQDISGLTLLSLLKNYSSNTTPIIAMTVLDNPNIILSSHGLGATECFVKPLDNDKILNAVQKLMVP